MGVLRAIEGLLLLVLRLGLGALFLWAAWVKLDNPQAFADSIKGFKILPPEGDHLVMLATYAVPWVEGLAGAVLVFGLWSRAAALLLLVNLLVFIGAIVSVLERGISTKCGCFGKFSPFCPETITTCNIIQNGVLAAVALLILWRGPGLVALDRGPKPKASKGGAPAQPKVLFTSPRPAQPSQPAGGPRPEGTVATPAAAPKASTRPPGAVAAPVPPKPAPKPAPTSTPRPNPPAGPGAGGPPPARGNTPRPK